MNLVHAFEENKNSSRKEHISRYFGYVKTEDEDEKDDGSYVICNCGGRLIPMGKDSNNVDIGAVWHNLVMGDKRIRDYENGK